jgi:hypothetical protein
MKNELRLANHRASAAAAHQRTHTPAAIVVSAMTGPSTRAMSLIEGTGIRAGWTNYRCDDVNNQGHCWGDQCP